MQDGAKMSTLQEIEVRRATRTVVDADKQRISVHITLVHGWQRAQRRKNDTKEDAVGRTDQNGISSRARQKQ